MHSYPDGVTGLAAFCDVCGKQITKNGYVVWKDRGDDGQPADVLFIHQAICDPGHKGGHYNSMPLDAEIVYLANSAGVDLDSARKDIVVFASL
jgi:hypothetical protein